MALKTVKDSGQPSHRLFSLLLHSKQYRCTKSGSNWTLNSFYLQAIRLLNSSIVNQIATQTICINPFCTHFDTSHTLLLLFTICHCIPTYMYILHHLPCTPAHRLVTGTLVYSQVIVSIVCIISCLACLLFLYFLSLFIVGKDL
jgi:hypothetical protein